MLTAAYSALLYAIPVWHEVTNIKTYRDLITKTCRPSKRSGCCAYRTVSNNCLDILSGIPPTSLYVEQRCRLFARLEDRPTIVADILEKWAVAWDNSTGCDLWFKALIPDIRTFLWRPHGNTDFFMTQFFTGHGAFNSYLFRFKVSDSIECPSCGREDTPQHTFFECKAFSNLKSQLEAHLGSSFQINKVQDLLLSSQTNLNHISSYVRSVLTEKSKLLQPSNQQPPSSSSTPADGVPVTGVSGASSLISHL